MDSAQLQIVISAIDAASGSLAKVSDSLKGVGETSDVVNKQLSDGSRLSADSLNLVTDSAMRESSAIEGLKVQITQLTAIQAQTRDATLAQAGAMGTLENKTKTTNASFGKLAIGAGVLALGIGYAVEKSVKAYGDYQFQLERLVTSAGESQKHLQSVSDAIMATARDTGTSTQDLVAGMYYIESAGFHASNAIKVMQAAAKGAKDENADFKTVADATSTILVAYGMSANQSVQAVNAMITAVSRGKTTLQLFSNSLATVLPISASAHISFGEVAGALSTMTAEGMTAQRATQNLRNAIQHLQNPNTTQINALQQMGVNVVDLTTKLGQRGLTGTEELVIKAVQAHTKAGLTYIGVMKQSQSATQDAKLAIDAMPEPLKKIAQAYMNGTISSEQWRKGLYALSPQQRALALQFATVANKARGFSDELKAGNPITMAYDAELSKVFGTQQGLQVALMLSGTHAKTFHDNVKAVSSAMAEATDKVLGWENMQGTFNQQMSQLKEDFVTTGQEIGKAFIPMLTVAAKLLAILFMPIADMINRFPMVSAGILGLTGAFATLILVLLGIKKISGYIHDAREELQLLIKQEWIQAAAAKAMAVADFLWAAAQTAVNAATLAFEVLLDAVGIGELLAIIAAVLAALIALGIAIYRMVTHWKETKQAAVDAWQSIYRAWQGAIQFFINIGSDIKNAFNDVKNWLKNNWQAVLVAILLGPIIDAIILIKRNWSTIESFFSSSWSHIAGDAVQWGDNMASGIKAGWDMVTRNAPQWGLDLINGIVSSITSQKSGPTQGQGVASKLSEALGLSDLAKKGGFVGGLATAAEKLVNFDISSFINWSQTIDKFYQQGLAAAEKMLMGIGRTFMTEARQELQWGKDIVMGIGHGIAAVYNTVVQWGGSIISHARNGFNVSLKSMPHWGADMIHAIVSGLNGAWHMIESFFIGLVHMLTPVVMQTGSNVADKQLQGMSNPFKDIKKMKNLGNAILKGVGIAILAILGAIAILAVSIAVALLNGLVKAWKAQIKIVTTALRWLVEQIQHFFKDAGNWLYDAGASIIKGLVKGIKSESGHAVNAAKDVGSNIEKGFKNLLGIKSPSTVFQEIGQNIDQGLQKGITGNKDTATTAGKEVATSTVQAAKQAVTATNFNNPGSSSFGNGGGSGQALVGQMNIHFDGPVMGNSQQAQQFATQIYQALQQIARQHGQANVLPNIGIRPI